jgi:hypothetical protein
MFTTTGGRTGGGGGRGMLTTVGGRDGGRGTTVFEEVRPMLVPDVPAFPLGFGPFPKGRGVLEVVRGAPPVGVLGRGPLEEVERPVLADDGVLGRGPLLRFTVFDPPLLVELPEALLVFVLVFPLDPGVFLLLLLVFPELDPVFLLLLLEFPELVLVFLLLLLLVFVLLPWLLVLLPWLFLLTVLVLDPWVLVLLLWLLVLLPELVLDP